jgi:DNA-binding response OmpR family regulator
MAQAASNHPAHILVLGDDRALLGVLELVLQDEGYVVHGALWHGDGYALVSERRPDLLILDLMFSGRAGGLALLDQVKQEPALCAMPVLVCCALPAHLLEAHAAVLLRHGVPLLSKPFDLEHLLGMIEALLHGKGRGSRRPARRELLAHHSSRPRSRARAPQPAQAVA